MKIENTNTLLLDTESKSPLIKFFFNWLIINRRKKLSMLKTTNLYLSTEGSCQRLLLSDISLADKLISTNGEADFRLIVHAKQAVNINSLLIIRSHLGHTYIFMVALRSFYWSILILNTGTGAGKKMERIWDVGNEESNRNVWFDWFLCLHWVWLHLPIFPKGKYFSKH